MIWKLRNINIEANRNEIKSNHLFLVFILSLNETSSTIGPSKEMETIATINVLLLVTPSKRYRSTVMRSSPSKIKNRLHKNTPAIT